MKTMDSNLNKENIQFSQYIIVDKLDVIQQLKDYQKTLKASIVLLDKLDEKISEFKDSMYKIVFYLSPNTLESSYKEIHNILRYNPNILSLFILNAPTDNKLPKNVHIDNDLLYANVDDTAPVIFLVKTFVHAFSALSMRIENFELNYKVNLASNHISKLTKIGISLSNEKDFNKLLKDILYSAREICAADSGSLYLVERDSSGNLLHLRFKFSAMELDGTEFILPINNKSIAGYVANTGKHLNLQDVYNIPIDAEYNFNKEYDRSKGYHTKSMLTVPMKNHRDEVIGVVQLINRKKNFYQKLTLEQMKSNAVLPFDKYSEELVLSVAGQATVAIENKYLIKDIETLFEGFVTASVIAIESRDPTTSGHSFRVAEMTVGLAETIDKIDSGKYKPIKFSSEQMKEIRYASLLHDFGKVGVREKVLVKSKKLESFQIDAIHWRFYTIKKDIDLKFAKKKIDYLQKHGRDAFYNDYCLSLDIELKIEFEKMDEILNIITIINEPTVVASDHSLKLAEIATLHYEFTDGYSLPLITTSEFNYLSIKKGSLDFDERREIESHVEHTYLFLSKIPWTSDLKMIPLIAHAHHEKLNGTGYPRGLVADDIPIQSRMMTISDIFDALTDKDRPYKKAISRDRALDILKTEAKENHIDTELLNIFIESKLFERIKG